jgi:hypothetical protein
MQLVQKENWQKTSYFAFVKSFLIWSFTLTVCLLVVGFPVGALVVTVGALSAIVLQSVFPASAVLVVTGGILMLNVLIVVLGAAVLTLKGIHPQQVSWLHWLHGEAEPVNNSVYASCPLTCSLSSLTLD